MSLATAPTPTRPRRSIIENNAALLVLEGAQEHRPFQALLDTARARRMPVIFATPDAQAFAAGIAAGRGGEHYIQPPALSAFFGTPLALLLEQLNAQTLLIAGGRTSVEVHYTFVDAHQSDFFCRLAQDCMTGATPAAHEAALKAMEYMQTGARQNSATLVAALQAQQATP